MVEQVVAIEAPVHFEEVVTRLRKAWGLRRAGTRIRLAVKKAVRFAVSRKSIIKRGDFLWRPEQSELTPRRRSGEQALRIELICDEELAAAMHAILADQLATPRTELIRESAKLLGYQAVHSSTAERFESVLDMLLECGDLTVRGDGLIDARGT